MIAASAGVAAPAPAGTDGAGGAAGGAPPFTCEEAAALPALCWRPISCSTLSVPLAGTASDAAGAAVAAAGASRARRFLGVFTHGHARLR